MNNQEKQLYDLLAPTVLMEINTQELREKVSETLASYYTNNPKIICDETNNTQESIGRGELHISIDDKPFVFKECIA